MENSADPFITVATPRETPLSKNSTVPVADDGSSVAVKVTGLLRQALLLLLVIVTMPCALALLEKEERNKMKRRPMTLLVIKNDLHLWPWP